MQRSPDAPPDCSKLAANAVLFRERGIGVSGLFYSTPGWACDNSPRKLPTDLGVLYRACRDIAAAFGDTIADWEFFNEPDIGFLSAPAWDYASAFKAASLGFKTGNPKAPVLCAGLCTSPDGFYLKTLLENGAAPYFDVFNYHTYAAPTSYHAFVGKMREALERAGVGDKPIWITESGTNFEGPARNESVRKGIKAHAPEQELVVAEFAPKSVIAMQMEGIERDFFFILAAYSERNGGKDWGLLRRDGTVKPAYAALATMARELRGARLIGTLDTSAGIRAYLYEHADGLQTVVFWAESKIDTATNGNEVVKTVTAEAREWALPGFAGAAPAAPLRLVDLCGSPGELAPTNADGSLTLSATRYPAYVTGLRWLKAANGATLGGARGEESPRPLQNAMRASFEVKAAQDKVENDFGEANLMLVRGEEGGSPADWLRYQPPIGTWERRYVELSSCPDLGEVDAILLGANPQGMRLTFWVRDISALRTRQ